MSKDESPELMVRDANGKERVLLDPQAWSASKAEASALSYFQASPTGRFVAVGISTGGSENAELSIVDADTGKVTAGPINNAQFGAISWAPDESKVFFNRLAVGKNSDASTRYLGSTAVAWDFKSRPEPIALRPLSLDASSRSVPTPIVRPGARIAFLLVTDGVSNDAQVWTKLVRDLDEGGIPWVRLAQASDGITDVAVRGNEIYLLSHRNAPTFQVLRLQYGQDLARATIVVPASNTRTLYSIHAAEDALYVRALEKQYFHVLRWRPGGVARELRLPMKGTITHVFADPRRAGVSFEMENWVVPSTIFRYDPRERAVREVTETGTVAREMKYVVRSLSGISYDSTKIPLDLVEPARAGKNIVLLDAYGAYGLVDVPTFDLGGVVLLRHGVDLATCHVRGGGELGEAWHMAGKGLLKPNGWRDLIACAETLVAAHLATPGRLFIAGYSAGGIVTAMAMVTRPDLFAGVIENVALINTLRLEAMTSGPANVPEFGSVGTPEGFRALYAMDAYAHIRTGVRYPAILAIAGGNDLRVNPWQAFKFVARMQASGSRKPVLLRYDEHAGHGFGSTSTQLEETAADVAAFIFWQSGLPDWQPSTR